MLIRIVKMTFQNDKIDEFLAFLEPNKVKIRNFQGCKGLEFLRGHNESAILMTYSHWESENDLENYRKSELFEFVWAKTKIHFADKPEAWTLELLDKL